MVTPLTAVRRMHLHCGLVKAQSSQSEGWSKATWLVSRCVGSGQSGQGASPCRGLHSHTPTLLDRHHINSIHSTTQPLDPLRLQGLWTLLAECFAAFVHTTCLLSVPGQYATLGRIQDPRSNCSLKPLDSWRQWEQPSSQTGEPTGLSPFTVSHSRELVDAPAWLSGTSHRSICPHCLADPW